jgi:chorismate mutase
MVTSAVVATTLANVAPATAGPAKHSAEPPQAASSPDRTASLSRLSPLTDIVVRRLLISDEVAASKFGTPKPIDDPVREQQELEKVRRRAAALDLDPHATVQFFEDQIKASKVVQEGDFTRWTAHPEEAPTTRPSLDQIRAELDELTTELLDELKTTQQLRGLPLSCSVQLRIATQIADVFDGLDPLHRHALDIATQSVCRTYP